MARFHVNEALQNFEGRAEMIERLSISRGRGGIGSLSLSLFFSLPVFEHGTGCLLVCFEVSSLIFHAFTRPSTPKRAEKDGQSVQQEEKEAALLFVSVDRAALSVLCSRPQVFFPRAKGETKDKLQRRPSRDPSHLSIGNWSNEPDQIQRNPDQDPYSSLIFDCCFNTPKPQIRREISRRKKGGISIFTISGNFTSAFD